MSALDRLKRLVGRRSGACTPAVVLGSYLVFLTCILVLLATVSLRWRIVHDSPLMLYAGCLQQWLGINPVVLLQHFADKPDHIG